MVFSRSRSASAGMVPRMRFCMPGHDLECEKKPEADLFKAFRQSASPCEQVDAYGPVVSVIVQYAPVYRVQAGSHVRSVLRTCSNVLHSMITVYIRS